MGEMHAVDVEQGGGVEKGSAEEGRVQDSKGGEGKERYGWGELMEEERQSLQKMWNFKRWGRGKEQKNNRGSK